MGRAVSCDTLGFVGAGSTLIGSMLGRFRVDRLLGRGGMGAVYAAFDEKLERDVAIKVLNEEGDAALQKKRLMREARLAAKLTHPSIATVYEVDELDGRLVIVMELLEGSSLRRVLLDRRMGVDEAISVGRDVARALARAHLAGIIHRDIKPENIFITSPSPDALLAKVLDFGLARQRPPQQPGVEQEATDTTTRGDMWGTPGYVSPEQAHGQPVDVRTDVFSFGIMMYEMLSGQKPFQGENPIAVMIATSKRDPNPLRDLVKDLPPEIDEIVKRCLMKKREDRFANATELSAALEAFVRGTSPSKLGNMIGSSPNLPALTNEQLAAAAATQLPPSANAPTTGGSAALEMNTTPDIGLPPIPLPLDQQRSNHRREVFAVGGGIALAFVVTIIGTASLGGGKSKAAHHRRTADAAAAVTSVAVASEQPPPPSTVVVAPEPTPSPAPTLDEPPAADPPTAPTVAAATATAHPTATPRPQGTIQARGDQAKKPKPADCADPFTKDAKGVKIPKLHCF